MKEDIKKAITDLIYNGDAKLEEGTEVTVNVPFTYTIGEEGPFTGNLLETIEDCKAEAEAELLNGLSGEISMDVEVELTK